MQIGQQMIRKYRALTKWVGQQRSFCFLIVLLIIVLHQQETHKKKHKKNVPQQEQKTPETWNDIMNGGKTKFEDFNTGNTRTYHMVCLTNRQAKLQWLTNCANRWVTDTLTYNLFCRECMHVQKHIVVYLQNGTEVPIANQNRHKYGIGTEVTFQHLNLLPKDYVIKNETAYFLGKSHHPNEPYNFFHFVKQIYFPLYWLMKSTNQLHDKSNNIVFYASPYAMCEGDRRIVYHDPGKFQTFRDLLFIKNGLELSSFVDKPQPDKVCYKNAVFSSTYFLDKAKEAIDYFKYSLKVRDDVCQPKTLTLINRASYRTMLNSDKLIKIAKDLGYNAKEVLMEKMTMEEQAQLIHCTNVLVGVAGAGLQWGYFMKDNSHVFEIAWPDKEWHFFFSATTGTYRTEEMGVVRPLIFHQIHAKCEIYPPAVNIYVKELFHRDAKLSHQQSLDILNDRRNYDYKGKAVISVGKLCNAIVDEAAFKNALMQVKSTGN